MKYDIYILKILKKIYSLIKIKCKIIDSKK